jgi:hypothetical protein
MNELVPENIRVFIQDLVDSFGPHAKIIVAGGAASDLLRSVPPKDIDIYCSEPVTVHKVDNKTEFYITIAGRVFTMKGKYPSGHFDVYTNEEFSLPMDLVVMRNTGMDLLKVVEDFDMSIAQCAITDLYNINWVVDFRTSSCDKSLNSKVIEYSSSSTYHRNDQKIKRIRRYSEKYPNYDIIEILHKGTANES